MLRKSLLVMIWLLSLMVLKVLIIYDEPGHIIITKRYLRNHSTAKCVEVEIDEARTVSEGLEKLADGKHDLVLMDNQINEDKGYDYVLAVKESNSEARLVGMSMDGDYGLMWANAGAEGFFLKWSAADHFMGFYFDNLKS